MCEGPGTIQPMKLDMLLLEFLEEESHFIIWINQDHQGGGRHFRLGRCVSRQNRTIAIMPDNFSWTSENILRVSGDKFAIRQGKTTTGSQKGKCGILGSLRF